MSRQAHMQTTLARTSQLRKDASLLHTLATSVLQPCISPSTPSPKNGAFAWDYAEASTEPFGAVHPLSAFVAGPDGQRAQQFVCCLVATASLYSPPSDECFHRAPLLPYFPCSPSVTRLGAYPAPCGTARLCFGLSAALRVSAFRKSLCRERKRFSEPSEKAPLGTWERGTSRRFAQECPEGNPGKYKQGETQWHSTKTKSL